jgi:hypothetical protein
MHRMIQIYKKLVKPTLPHGSKSWTIQTRDKD